MTRPAAGSIVLVDWRRGGLPKEPNKLRPAVVVDDSSLFDDEHQNLIVVPLTTEIDWAIPALSVSIDPTPENRCAHRSYALAFNVTAVSRRRAKPTDAKITAVQLRSIRERICLCIGVT